MREYIVTSPLMHDGKHYSIADTVRLDDLTAGTLIAARTVAEPEVAEDIIRQALRGSDYLPAVIRLSSTLTVPQTEAVDRAFAASGLDMAAWNGLSDDERELRITGALELMREHELGPVLSERGLGGIGTQAAMAEGARVLADNATQAPEVRAAEAIVEGATTGDGPTGALAGVAAASALTPVDGGATAGAGTADRVGSIRGVLASLIAGADFTAAGEPKIEAVERLAGFRPTRAEIAEARAPLPPID